jgi:hypothetical protein
MRVGRFLESHLPDGHYSLSGPAGQHDYAAASIGSPASVKGLYGAVLIVPYFKGLSLEGDIPEINGTGFALFISGQILHGKPYLDQGLFDMAAEVLDDPGAVSVQALFQIGLHLSVIQDFIEKDGIL